MTLRTMASPSTLAIGRLRRFVAIERAYGRDLNAGGLALLRRATFAAFVDCLDSGRPLVASEARRLIARP